MQSLCSKDSITNGHLSTLSSLHVRTLGSHFILQSEEDDFPLVHLVIIDIGFFEVCKLILMSPSGHSVGFQFNSSGTALGLGLTQDRKQILTHGFER
jgi:hypothetical protein